jgi:hypothetical protein
MALGADPGAVLPGFDCGAKALQRAYLRQSLRACGMTSPRQTCDQGLAEARAQPADQLLDVGMLHPGKRIRRRGQTFRLQRVECGDQGARLAADLGEAGLRIAGEGESGGASAGACPRRTRR